MILLWLKAFHLIFMVAWFAGLFYLPRLFVYHAEATDQISIARFKIMEHRLFYFITTPAAILTLIFGLWMLILESAWIFQAGWLHAKLTLVFLLFIFHIYCGYLVNKFKKDQISKSSKFFRLINEIPTIFLISIIILAVVKPF